MPIQSAKRIDFFSTLQVWSLNLFYLIILILASPWLVWRFFRYGKNRRGWSQKLWGQVPLRNSAAPCIWFHAVSVGEVNLVQPLYQQLQTELEGYDFVISTTTETGYDLARKKYPDSIVFFFPFYFSWAIKRSISRIKPSMVVLAELEIWPNIIRLLARLDQSANQQKIPLVIVNGRLSESSFRGYQRIGRWIRSSFQSLDAVCTQDQTYADRFIALGCPSDRVTITGNLKYDGVNTDRHNPKTTELRKMLPFPADSFIFLAGSTQEDEDLLAAEVYQKLSLRFPRLRLILAPRHPERCSRLIQRLQDFNFHVIRRSELERPFSETTAKIPSIILINVIGELSAWWGVADAAYVGGSMGTRGGQNMIEPAAYGVPVSFGPNTKNFQTDVKRLLAVDGAIVVKNSRELSSFVERCLVDQKWAVQLGTNAKQEISQHRGAADRTSCCIKRLLPVQISSGANVGSFYRAPE